MCATDPDELIAAALLELPSEEQTGLMVLTIRAYIRSAREAVVVAVRPWGSGPLVREKSQGTRERPGMVLHELATSAVKYGALPGDGGRVTVTWSTEGEGMAARLVLHWAEAGGPAVRENCRSGAASDRR